MAYPLVVRSAAAPSLRESEVPTFGSPASESLSSASRRPANRGASRIASLPGIGAVLFLAFASFVVGQTGRIGPATPKDGTFGGPVRLSDGATRGAAVADPATACVPSVTAMCLANGRFRVEVQWRRSAADPFSAGRAVPITSDTGYFWFFDSGNIELVVKVLNGCTIDAAYWVFAGGLTNVELDLKVTDVQTGQVRNYPNPPGTAFVPVQDTSAFACSSGAVAYDWRQFDFDSRHSGSNTLESIVSAGNVASLGILFAVQLPEVADGAPAVAAGIATPSGTRDLLFVTTKAGRIVALDARTGATVWTTTSPPGPKYTTSSPAIDPGRQFVYGYGLDGFVHKYNIADGTEVTSGGWPELATLKPDVEKGSSALSIASPSGGVSYLYAANGGYPGDAGDYQGHLTTIRLSDGVQNVFNANCSDRTIHFVENGGADNDCSHVQTAIWARAGAVYDARTGRIYATTGNGDFDGNAGGHDWGDSVLALSPNGTGLGGNPLDSYTPTEYQHLQNTDADLGSTAPALLPVTDTRVVSALGLQSGKDASAAPDRSRQPERPGRARACRRRAADSPRATGRRGPHRAGRLGEPG